MFVCTVIQVSLKLERRLPVVVQQPLLANCIALVSIFINNKRLELNCIAMGCDNKRKTHGSEESSVREGV